MSTAIVRIYTSEGFVIAADSLGSPKTKDGEVKPGQANQQKIFPAAPSLAFALSGWIEVSNSATGERLTWGKLACEIALEMEFQEVNSITHYSTMFCGKLRKWLQKIWEDRADFREVYASDTHQQSTMLFTAGYFNGKPVMNETEMMYEPLGRIRIKSESPETGNALRVGERSLRGSQIIYDILREGGHPDFQGYQTPAFRKLIEEREKLTLDEACSAAETYIRACSDKRAIELDKNCETIGGEVQMATITPRGFKWVKKSVPLLR